MRIAVWIAAACALSAAGCFGPERLHRTFRGARESAYERRSAVRAAEADALPVLSGKLTLEDAIKVALAWNKPLRAALEDKEIARGRVVESYGEVLPSVSAVGSYGRVDQLRGFKVGTTRVYLGDFDNYSADLQVRQPIFRGGAIGAALRAAQIYSYLADEAVRAQIQATIFEVASAYYEALLAEKLYEANRAAVESAERHLADVRTKFSQGVASRFDVLRAEVDVSNFQADAIREQNRLHLAKTRLLKGMGVSQETEVALAGELAYEPARPVLEEAMRIAQTNRPDLTIAEAGVRLQEEALRIAKSRYWPSVDATFVYGWAYPDPHTSLRDWDDRWVAGVEVALPLFDGLRREGRVIQEGAALERRKVELRDAEERAALEVQQALLSLRDAEELAESQRLNLERAQEGLRLAEVGFREGVTTEVEVVDARAALTRARGLYYQAIHAHTMARLSLQLAMGILGPAAGDRTPPEDVRVRPADPAVLAPTDSGEGR